MRDLGRLKDEVVDHLILHLLAEAGRPIRAFYPVFDPVGLNIRTLPFVTEDSIRERLNMLIKGGFVCIRDQQGSVIRSQRIQRQTIHEAARETSSPRNVYLTKAGGRKWEVLSMPDWSRSFRFWRDENKGQIVSPDLTLGVALILSFESTALNEVKPDIDRVTIRDIQAYKILYWKQLDRVFELTFPMILRTESNRRPEWLRRWDDDLRWYRYPWECERWQELTEVRYPSNQSQG
jgi:hypothetical protein